MSENRKAAALILADGTVWTGVSIGVPGTSIGEIVFTTGVSGFQETLTDPSNFGQIVVQTFPSVGGYGVNNDDFSSPSCYLNGYVVRSLTTKPSNYKMTDTLGHFLEQRGIVGIEGVDTRAITRHIRANGAMNAMISTEFLTAAPEVLERIRSWKLEGAVEAVLPAVRSEHPAPNQRARVCLVDFGGRAQSVAALNRYGIGVTCLPASTPAADLLAGDWDGFVLSEGPGDPADAPYRDTVRALLDSGRPVLGLGLGHQLMALALGGRCRKLLHGHRGANQPVKNAVTGHVYVTTQNHGYVVDETALPDGAVITETNLNDGTVAALAYGDRPAFSVQYEPESVVGGRDKGAVYRRFLELIEAGRK